MTADNAAPSTDDRTPIAEEAGLKIAAKPEAGSPEALAAEAEAKAVAEAAAKEKAAKEAALADDAVEYDPTGDAALDVALEFVGRLGIGPEHPAMQAATAGDFSLLAAHLGTLGDKAKGFERMVKLGEDAFKRGAKEHADAKAKADAEEAATKARIFQAMGGEENWPRIQAWAAANATDAEKLNVQAAFKAGGAQAVAMAEYLTKQYRKSGGEFSGKSALKEGTASTGKPATTPLDPKSYAQAAATARREYKGRDWDSSPEYAALRRRLKA